MQYGERTELVLWTSSLQAWSMPLVGVWLAGVMGPKDAHVWAACARSVLPRAARDKVLLPDNSFLVLIYSPGDQASRRLWFHALAHSHDPCRDVLQHPPMGFRGA